MKIAVLRGGHPAHYDDSLKTGEFVLSTLRAKSEQYQPLDVFISKDGDWYSSGLKQPPAKIISRADLIWNGLHHDWPRGESATRLMTQLNIPYTGSTTLGLGVATNRDLIKRAYNMAGLPTLRYEVLTTNASLDDLLHVFRTFVHPVVVKPVQARASLGVRLAHSFEELKEGVASAFKHAKEVLVEEGVKGERAVCGVIEGFRDSKLYSLIPTPNKFKSTSHKEIERLARLAHEALGLRHYSLSHFVVTPKGKVYIVETDAQPELHQDSALVTSLKSVGIAPQEFIDHIISLTK